jgi:hypothetical protein
MNNNKVKMLKSDVKGLEFGVSYIHDVLCRLLVYLDEKFEDVPLEVCECGMIHPRDNEEAECDIPAEHQVGMEQLVSDARAR